VKISGAGISATLLPVDSMTALMLVPDWFSGN
jgi:hypothetical protein